MTIDNITNELYDKTPKLKGLAADEGDYVDGLSHMIFSIVFVKYMISCYKNKDRDFKKCVEFMDNMLISDAETRELLSVSVIEELLQERDLLSSVKSLGSSKLRDEITQTEKNYGWI